MKYKFIVVLILLIVIGNHIGSWKNFLLLGSQFELKGENSDHAFLVDNQTGNLIVGQHIVDLDKDGNFIFILRVKADSYDCLTKYGDKLTFTHYSDELEIAVIELTNRTVNFYSKYEFLNWLQENELKSSFVFSGYYSNNRAFAEVNTNKSCSLIAKGV